MLKFVKYYYLHLLNLNQLVAYMYDFFLLTSILSNFNVFSQILLLYKVVKERKSQQITFN